MELLAVVLPNAEGDYLLRLLMSIKRKPAQPFPEIEPWLHTAPGNQPCGLRPQRAPGRFRIPKISFKLPVLVPDFRQETNAGLTLEGWATSHVALDLKEHCACFHFSLVKLGHSFLGTECREAVEPLLNTRVRQRGRSQCKTVQFHCPVMK
jgi:hypothetical protein